MFTHKQYRAKAAEYAELAKAANNPNEVREFQKLKESFAVLADNEQWLVDSHAQTMEVSEVSDSVTLAAEEEHILRCLGAAVIMQWDTLPKKLQRELFDNAISMGELSDILLLRGRVSRFLHKHKDGVDEMISPTFVRRDEYVLTP